MGIRVALLTDAFCVPALEAGLDACSLNDDILRRVVLKEQSFKIYIYGCPAKAEIGLEGEPGAVTPGWFSPQIQETLLFHVFQWPGTPKDC